MKDWVLSQEVTSGLSSLMSGILGGGILILPFVPGLLPWLPGFVWSFPDLFLSLLSPWIFMVGFGWSGLCIFRLLFMVLKPLCWPLIACASFARLFKGWSGLVVSLWLVLVLSSACWMDPPGVILLFVLFGSGLGCFGGISCTLANGDWWGVPSFGNGG